MLGGQQSFVSIGVIVGIIFEVSVLCAACYGAVRLVTKFTEMRREIEELTIAVRRLERRA